MAKAGTSFLNPAHAATEPLLLSQKNGENKSENIRNIIKKSNKISAETWIRHEFTTRNGRFAPRSGHHDAKERWGQRSLQLNGLEREEKLQKPCKKKNKKTSKTSVSRHVKGCRQQVFSCNTLRGQDVDPGGAVHRTGHGPALLPPQLRSTIVQPRCLKKAFDTMGYSHL